MMSYEFAGNTGSRKGNRFMFKSVIDSLSGYKTYIVGVAMVAGGLVKMIDGDMDSGLRLIGEGLSVAFMRAAISKISA